MSNQELIDKLFIHQVLLSTKDDMIPEERSVYTFYVTSASAGATISAESSRATITFAASDFPYGLIGFDSDDDIRVSEVNYFSLSPPHPLTPPPPTPAPHPSTSSLAFKSCTNISSVCIFYLLLPAVYYTVVCSCVKFYSLYLGSLCSLPYAI